MTRLLFRAIPRDCWAAAWESATATTGGIFLAAVILAVLHAAGGVG